LAKEYFLDGAVTGDSRSGNLARPINSIDEAHRAGAGRREMAALYEVLLHKYYVDELYDALVVIASRIWGHGSVFSMRKVIDGVGVDGERAG